MQIFLGVAALIVLITLFDTDAEQQRIRRKLRSGDY